VHNGVRVPAGDIEGRKKLARYMLRAPLSLEKMTYDANTGMVIYRSHMHPGLKRNFQLMPGAQWLELLGRHIPDRFEHLVRYVGWYSTRCRGERARAAASAVAVQAAEDGQGVAARARSAWARLIHKVYEVDPLECPKCGAPMQVIALIDERRSHSQNPRTSGLLGAAAGATESARAAGGREGTKITGARTDLPSCSRHRLNC